LSTLLLGWSDPTVEGREVTPEQVMNTPAMRNVQGDLSQRLRGGQLARQASNTMVRLLRETMQAEPDDSRIEVQPTAASSDAIGLQLHGTNEDGSGAWDIVLYARADGVAATWRPNKVRLASEQPAVQMTEVIQAAKDIEQARLARLAAQAAEQRDKEGY
jgi:hypothetical protein